MARFDVYPAPGGEGFLLDLQTDLLDGIATRVVAPLIPEVSAPTPMRLLNPVIEVAGVRHVLATHLLSAVPSRVLTRPISNAAESADPITRAVDMVFQGF